MKALVYMNKVDKFGRIILPSFFRRMFKIDAGSDMEIFVEDECIILQKYSPKCVFCGVDSVEKVFLDKAVCKSCLDVINIM